MGSLLPKVSSRYLAALAVLLCFVGLSLLLGVRDTQMFQPESVSTAKRGSGKMKKPSKRRKPGSSKPLLKSASRTTSPRSSHHAANRDVSSILDIAIIGFPKSGTTSMQEWLGQSDEIYIDDDEKLFLSHGRADKLVEHFQKVNKKHPKVMNAIKFPGDIDTPYGLQTLEENFPNTKLIVMLRHPVQQFESFYNYRFRNKLHRKRIRFSDPRQLIGSCRRDQTRYSCADGWDIVHECTKGDNVCTDRGQMHQAIARLGLTPMNASGELSLLGDLQMTVHPWKRPVLFIEMNQLAEGSDQFHQDVQSFVGVSHLPERFPHSNDGSLDRVKGEIDICSLRYHGIRTLLQEYAQKTSEWILKYLLESELAVVSNETQFVELIKNWQSDPCKDSATTRMENSVYQSLKERAIAVRTEVRKKRTRHERRDPMERQRQRDRREFRHLVGKDLRKILHFAIIGFPKCGTTSMMRWIRSSPSVYMGKEDKKEIPLLTSDRPLKLAAMFLHENPDRSRVKNGIKFPGDIDSPHGLNNMVKHYNKTKLIIMVRHPVLWFESFYNFRGLNVPSTHLVGSCRKDHTRYGCSAQGDHGCVSSNVCTDRGLFHQAISRLGLTPMDTTEELELLGDHGMKMHEWKRPVMFVELNQLKQEDATRTDQLHRDLSSFLELTDLPPEDMTVYNKHQEVANETRSNILDICSSSNRHAHSVLMDHARAASRWILDYLLDSELAVVSSREYFIELVADWQNDPCIRRREEDAMDETHK